MEPIRVAIIGTRGIPANYGGFETFAEELSVRLAARGHHVVVYGRSNNIDYPHKEYKGVRLVILPTISRKHLDTIANTFLSVFHVIIHRADIVLIPNTGNAVLSWIPRIFRTPVLMNVDGLEWKRQKWGKTTKKLLKFSEWLATWMPNQIVTDAQVIQDYYKNKYNKHSWMIPYGAYISRQINEEDLKKFELKNEKYLLYVSRLEPENNALMVIEAYLQSQTDMNLVIVGDAPYAHDYIRKLKSTANDNVKFLGFVFGRDYRLLQQNAYAYIHATEVGGTHPALIEAMGFGNCVLTYNTPENLEAAGSAAIPFADRNELADKLRMIAAQPEIVDNYRESAVRHVRERYNWDNITDQYEDLLMKMIRKKGR